MLSSFQSGEFLLHIPCWLHFHLGSFSYTSHAGFIFIWRVSLTHHVLASFLSKEFLLHLPCWLLFLLREFLLHILCWRYFFYLGSFSYTSHARFIFLWGVSVTHPMLTFFFFFFFFHLRSFSYTSSAGFIYVGSFP